MHVDDKVVRFACGTKVKKMQRQKVIYSHVTPINDDKEEHYREKILLYTHWRDEEKDLIGGFSTFEQSYNAKSEEINANKSQYEKTDAEFYNNIQENIEAEHLSSVIHPEAQHQELLDAEEGLSQTAALGCFDPGVGTNDGNVNYDLGEDLGISRRHVEDGELPHRELDNEEYMQSVRVLNYEQKRFFYHILHKIKSKSLPFFTFLSGGAGCGKSVLIKAIHQALLKYFNHDRDEDPSTVKVLLCAPTGKAAHNIGG